jgi:serine/threonine protein phosphatase PrpC
MVISGEAQRIRQRRGRIFALPEEPEVARVWLPKYNSPGLAMARAFGDFCLKDHGVISMPDVSYHHITEKDEFVVLATDGVSRLSTYAPFSECLVVLTSSFCTRYGTCYQMMKLLVLSAEPHLRPLQHDF